MSGSLSLLVIIFLRKKLNFFHLYFMQMLSVDVTIFKKEIECFFCPQKVKTKPQLKNAQKTSNQLFSLTAMNYPNGPNRRIYAPNCSL